MDKSHFTDQFAFKLAQGQAPYAGVQPIDPKISGECQRDRVLELGSDTLDGIGGCALAAECTFSNDKYKGVTGHCLKQIVGFDTDCL